MEPEGSCDEKDETKRKSRNLSEKKRRDQFNILVTELGSMVSPNNNSRKMDKTTVLKHTINFLRSHNESSKQTRANEVEENWKPSFLSNEEFTHLMLEALDGFIMGFSASNGRILYVSENVTALLGYVPIELLNQTLYDVISEDDKVNLYNTLMTPNLNSSLDNPVNIFLHLKRGGFEDSAYELVKLSGCYRRWHDTTSGGGGCLLNDSDDDDISIKSGQSSSISSYAHSAKFSTATTDEKIVFIATVRLQTAQLLREIPVVRSVPKSEFTSRYSLEWKFLFLDHRAPPIIGYLPFELLGTSGYDYYHMDDLDRVSQCHENLMQKGEGTSCHYRFLTKGQQWIWLQTRYFITYHQWNSKPEFVVATHRVISYADVIKQMKKDREKETTGGGAESEAGSCEVKSRYATTGSPTWSSRSSTGTGTTSCTRISQDQQSGRPVPNFSERQDNFFNEESDGADGLAQPKDEVRSSLIDSNSFSGFQDMKPPQFAPTPVLIQAPPPAVRPILISPPEQIRQPILMSPAQMQLQEQLRTKHSELTRKIMEQQEELRRVSEQLVMSQYGLIPVNVAQQTPDADQAFVSMAQEYVPVSSMQQPMVSSSGYTSFSTSASGQEAGAEQTQTIYTSLTSTPTFQQSEKSD